MRSRTTLAAALLAILGTTLATADAAGAGTEAAPTTTVPAPPPTCTCPPATAAPAPTTAVAAPATTAAAPTTVVAGATTVAAPPTPAGTGLPANATVDQLVAAVQPMFGPTTDAMGEFAIFGVAPLAGVPTPVGATVEEFEIAFDDLPADDPFYRGVLVLTSTQPAPELVTLYQTELVASGFVQTGDSVDNISDGLQVRRLEYQVPNATHPMSSFTVEIADDDVDSVSIEWRDAIDTAVAAGAVAAFRSWSGLPLIGAEDPIEDATIGNYISGERLHIATSYHLALPAADVEPQLLAALAGTAFSVNPDLTRPGEYVDLAGGPFQKLTVYFGESYLIDGNGELVVDAYVSL